MDINEVVQKLSDEMGVKLDLMRHKSTTRLEDSRLQTGELKNPEGEYYGFIALSTKKGKLVSCGYLGNHPTLSRDFMGGNVYLHLETDNHGPFRIDEKQTPFLDLEPITPEILKNERHRRDRYHVGLDKGLFGYSEIDCHLFEHLRQRKGLDYHL